MGPIAQTRYARILLSSTFIEHIVHVVCVSAKEQMGRIDARGIVAAMQNVRVFGD